MFSRLGIAFVFNCISQKTEDKENPQVESEGRNRMTTVNEHKNNWSRLEHITSSKRDVSKMSLHLNTLRRDQTIGGEFRVQSVINLAKKKYNKNKVVQ